MGSGGVRVPKSVGDVSGIYGSAECDAEGDGGGEGWDARDEFVWGGATFGHQFVEACA